MKSGLHLVTIPGGGKLPGIFNARHRKNVTFVPVTQSFGNRLLRGDALSGQLFIP